MPYSGNARRVEIWKGQDEPVPFSLSKNKDFSFIAALCVLCGSVSFHRKGREERRKERKVKSIPGVRTSRHPSRDY